MNSLFATGGMLNSLSTLALSLPDPSGALLTAFGIGLVIFVHEFGHFLCARMVGIDVEVFSLGFGPKIIGFVRGGTDYRIAAVPLGGYVKVRGDQPGEDEHHPRSYHNKTIGQKFLVRAGGVLANLLFALIVFPLTFGVGVRMEAPVVGRIAPGGPAWKAGLAAGDEVLEISGRPIHSFNDVFLEVALGNPEALPIRVRRDGTALDLIAKPEYSEAQGTYVIRVEQSVDPRLTEVRDAARTAGIKVGDILVAVDGCRRPEYFAELLTSSRGESRRLLLRDEAGQEREVVLRPTMQTNSDGRIIGIAACVTTLTAVRGSLADPSAPLRVGDRIRAIGGRTVWSDLEIVTAVAELSSATTPVTIVRDGVEQTFDVDTTLVKRFPDDAAFGATDARPGDEGVPIAVTPNTAAALAGLNDGDRIRAVGDQGVATFKELQQRIQSAESDEIALTVTQAGGSRVLSIRRGPLSYPDYGVAFEGATLIRRYPWVEAFQHGFYASWNMTRQVYLTLKKMVSRQVSTENLGSIVSISVVSYHFALQGLAKLFYFLALLSINLAVINVLPIPILDGGYMLFLIIEKITGTPISEKVMGYAQMIGMAFIFGLLIYVIKNDIQRFLF